MRFWNKTADEIYIYGDIVSEKLFDNDVTAKAFVDDLKSFGDKSVTIHVNSSGGDVFTALAISNVIKARGNTNIIIDGICASAATLIAVAGSHISMANNALFMIHEPAVYMSGYYQEAELVKVETSLNAIQETLIQTYKSRPLSEDVNLEDMLLDETWMSATEAKNYGFVDEVIGESELEFNNNTHCLFVNKVAIDCRNVRDEIFASIRKVENNMQAEIAAAVQAERDRIGILTDMRSENSAVNALIDLAIKDGKSVAEIKPYIAAVTANTPQSDTLAQITAIIRDQLQSGAEGVATSMPEASEADKKREAIDKLVNYANGR